MQYVREIQLAGLLHDIGKLYQKGVDSKIEGISTSGPHGKVSGNFIKRYSRLFEGYGIDVEALTEFTVRHHTNDYGEKEKNAVQMVSNAPERYKKYCEIISIADNLSSKERGSSTDEEKRETSYKIKPLSSIFTRALGDEQHKWNHDPVEYTIPFISKMLPSDTHDKNNPYAVYGLINVFTRAIDMLEMNAPETFEGLMETLNFLIAKYCWSIPSAHQNKIADISLYDHLKTTSAIALALYSQVYTEYGEGFKKANVGKVVGKLKLIKVDMLGISEWLGVASTIDVINRVATRQAMVKKIYDNIDKELIGCGLCVTSNVIDTGSTKYFMESESLENVIISKLETLSSMLAINTDLIMSLTVQVVEFGDASRFERLPEVIGEFSGAINNTKLSVISMLSGKDGWLDNIEDHKQEIITEKEDNAVELIEEFIEEHPNMEKLDLIRIDIDNMQRMFETGWVYEGKRYDSISRLSTMSRMIAGYMHDSIPKEYSECYFIINTSDDILCMADSRESVNTTLAIRNQIDQFSLGQLKVSCAIVRYTDKYSLKTLIQSMEMELGKVKKSGGNKLSYVGTLINWEHAEEYEKLVDELTNIASKPKDLSNILYRLMEYSNMYKKYIETGDPVHLMCISRIAVDSSKNYGNRERPNVPIGLQLRIKNAFKGSLVNRNKVDPFVYNLAQAVNDAMLFSKSVRHKS